jgi:hypothetical protein
MRIMVAAAALMLMASQAMAGEIDDAHRQALAGRDSYWNCLAREYTQDSGKNLSGQDFTQRIADACPSERQNFRVTLMGYLSMQAPAAEAGAHLATANNAIALAQRDIVIAFVKHAQASK